MIIPGPRGLPLIGNLLPFARDPFHFLLSSQREYGDVVRFRFGSISAYLLAHPDSVRHVLLDNSQHYDKRIGYVQMKPLVGDGLLVSEGDVWRRQRHLLQPPFQPQHLDVVTRPMLDAVSAMLERWEASAGAGEPVEIVAEMTHLTHAIMGRMLFGIDFSAAGNPLGRALAVAQQLSDDFTLRLTHSPLAILAGLASIPAPLPRRVREQLRELDRVIYDLIAVRRREGADRGDWASLLLTARDPHSGEPLTDQEVRDQIVTLWLAGTETPAVGLAWACYLLAQHPQIERRLDAELAHVLGGRVPTWDDLPALTYTVMILHESMRLYPPAWLIVRTSIHDVEIGGFNIPARSMILLSPYVTQRHPALWADPGQFEPERFAPEEIARRSRFAYFPFGGGPRQCLGNHMALVEMQFALAALAQQYRLRVAPGQRIAPAVMITLRPREGIWMYLERK
jgi:cytochrome P450